MVALEETGVYITAVNLFDIYFPSSVMLNLSNNWSKQSNLEDFLGSKTKRKDKKSKGNSSNSGNKRKFTIPKKNKDTEDNSNLAGGE